MAHDQHGATAQSRLKWDLPTRPTPRSGCRAEGTPISEANQDLPIPLLPLGQGAPFRKSNTVLDDAQGYGLRERHRTGKIVHRPPVPLHLAAVAVREIEGALDFTDVKQFERS